MDIEKTLQELIDNLSGMIERSMEEAKKEVECKYKPLHDYYNQYEKKSPKNLYQAVIQRESFKMACKESGLDYESI